MATEKFEDVKRDAVSKETLARKAAKILKSLNPGLKIKAKKMDHFHYSYGIAIEMESFMNKAILEGFGLKIPEGWSIKDQPNNNTFQLLSENKEVLFLRVTRHFK